MKAVKPSIMVVAGEASGDAHIAGCIAKVQENYSDHTWFGLGGDKMAEAGVTLLHHYKDTNVMGFVEVIKHYPKIKKVFKSCVQALKTERPKLLVLVDYPGFNLRLAKEAEKLGIKVLYFIGPKIWASRPKRLQIIKKTVAHMAVIFPFEISIYKKAKVPVSYVGNPLVSRIASADLTPLLMPSGSPVVGLLPGSRASELSKILPTQIEAALLLLKSYPDMQFVLPLADHLSGDEVARIIMPISDKLTVVSADKMYNAVRACDAVVCASGTATLEVALLKVPQVVVYKMSGLSFAIVKRIVTVAWASLVNIVAEKEVVKELLQDDFTAENVAEEVALLFGDKKIQMLKDYATIASGFGAHDTSVELAKCIETMLDD